MSNNATINHRDIRHKPRDTNIIYPYATTKSMGQTFKSDKTGSKTGNSNLRLP